MINKIIESLKKELNEEEAHLQKIQEHCKTVGIKTESSPYWYMAIGRKNTLRSVLQKLDKNFERDFTPCA